MKRLDLDRLQDRFIELVEGYQAQYKLNQTKIADLVGIQRSHFNAILKKQRKSSGYYIFKFLMKGIFRVDDIYNGQSDTESEDKFWETCRLSEDTGVMSKIVELRELGVDIDKVLDRLLIAHRSVK
jgi:hypothetical protein